MPTSGESRVPKQQAKQGSDEFFYKDQTGKKQDANLHNAILEEGDEAVARAVTRKRREQRRKAREREAK
jgi:hypothetical protein